MVRYLLRLEGAAVFLAALFCYARFDFSWPLFFVLFLVPDLSLLGYLAGPRWGAGAYNALHNYVLAAALIALGLAVSHELAAALGLILAGHVGLDRALGLGLKYPTAFRETHLQKV